ncbi:MAG: MFS transporter, partial [Perlucidibaca sp.]
MPDGQGAGDDGRIRRGTPAYRRSCLAMFLGGFSTFWLLYWPQPLLPHFARDFGLTPAASSAVLSSAMAALAFSLIPASLLADRFGRRALMNLAMLMAAALTLLTALVSDYHTLLLLRAVTGMIMSGLPATAMAYLGEEIEARALGSAMGLYIAGTALGGMSGRLCTAVLIDLAGWPLAAAAVGGIGLVSALVFWRVLPASRHFQPRPLPWSRQGRRAFTGALTGLLRDAGLPWLFATGFLLLGCFVSLYNYIGFRLEQPPFGLASSAIGGIFL